MGAALKPASEAELADIVASATEAFEIIGNGTRRGLGRPVDAQQTLDLSGFSGIRNYEPEELILEAGAATPLAEIEDAVCKAGQQLAFEPPDHSRLYRINHAGTLGGIFACNLAGPRRIKAGGPRDHVLGATGVTGRGEAFKAGARVMKNVTGYDLAKLLTGSHGTLAALTSITLKVLPKPETEETIMIAGLDDGAAARAMSVAMQSSCEVSGAAHLPGQGTYLRLEGIAPSVAYRREKLKMLFKDDMAVLGQAQSNAQWKAIRDVTPLDHDPARIVWRISVAPSEGPAVMAKIKACIEVCYFYDWAGGLIWLDVPPTDDASVAVIRGAISSGHATLMRAPEAVRVTVDVFQPQAPALAALSARVKTSFDPKALFNPGRMYRGV
jgi:glycolate oxidase FAD binding subunit